MITTKLIHQRAPLVVCTRINVHVHTVPTSHLPMGSLITSRAMFIQNSLHKLHNENNPINLQVCPLHVGMALPLLL